MSPMNPRLLRPLASGRFAAIAKDASGNVIQPVTYTQDGENYVAHIFNTSGTLEFLRAVDVEYLIVAGGGGGGMTIGVGSPGAGGGGAGGMLTGTAAVTAGGKAITVGAGGAGSTNAAANGANGSNSAFDSIAATGGGGGGSRDLDSAGSGGSSGGIAGRVGGNVAAIAGISGQGSAGGARVNSGFAGAGGGGKSQAGEDGPQFNGGKGGDGQASSITGTSVVYAGGGGGGRSGSGSLGQGGSGGGGDGGANGQNGLGGGGGGRSVISGNVAGSGGSGIVVVRYKRTAAALNYDPDAFAYIEAVQSADNAGLEPAVRDAINDFVVGCKADGIWSAIQSSCILMGARTLLGAITPLVGAAPTNVNFVSGDYDRKTGLVGDGATKQLNFPFNGSSVGQDDYHLAVFLHTSGTTARTWGSSGRNLTGSSNFASNGSRCRTSTLSGIGGITVPCLVGVERNTGASYVQQTTTRTTRAEASQTPANESTVLFNFSSGGSAFSDGRIGFYSTGTYCDLSLLAARSATLYDAIGAAIP